MSQHIWKNQRFTPETIDRAAYAIELGLKSGLLDVDDKLRWMGYIGETLGQMAYLRIKSRFVKKKPADGTPNVRGPFTAHRTNEPFWEIMDVYSVAGVAERAIRSGHKYANGVNRKNYHKAGGMLLTALAPRLNFDQDLVRGTPGALFDFIEEMIQEKPTEWDKIKNEGNGLYELDPEFSLHQHLAEQDDDEFVPIPRDDPRWIPPAGGTETHRASRRGG